MAVTGLLETQVSSSEPILRSKSDRRIAMAGLVTAVMVPALFWPLAAWAVASVTGVTVTATLLLALGATIAGFLTVVCGAVLMRG